MSQTMTSEEFMMIIAQKCSLFFKEMHELCDAYSQQVPLKKKTGNKSGVPKNSEIKDPDMPKKPSTAYILYFKNRKEKFLQQYPNFGITEITKLIAKEWSELSREKQIPFLRDAEKAKLDYIERMKEYASKHPGIKVPGEGRRRKNRPQGPLYQDIPVKKDGLLEESSEEEIDELEDEEVEASNQNNNTNNKIQIATQQNNQQNIVNQNTVPNNKVNGKRRVIQSDDDNSELSDVQEEEDSFEVQPSKKVKN
ncbi:hypothetical protein ABPG74_003154 [Tetrahymena malaccensis]